MIAVNTAIARVAADGMPIASISFSLKSAVATLWLSRQGVIGIMPTAQAASSSIKAVDETPAPVSGSPSTTTAQPSAGQRKTGLPDPSVKPTPIDPAVPPRPYNLDQLVSERSKAETDLDDMITEMRGRMKGR
jgi:serine protease Do